MTNRRLYTIVVDDINLTYTGPRGSTAHLHHRYTINKTALVGSRDNMHPLFVREKHYSVSLMGMK
jgi:hypothetical protein